MSANNEESKRPAWQASAWKIATGMCIGFGASQLTIVAKVDGNTKDISHINQRLTDEKTTRENQITRLTSSIDALIRQQSERLTVDRESMAVMRILVERNTK